MYHVSKCGFTSCKTGSKKTHTQHTHKKTPKATLLKDFFFFNYENAWLIKGCSKHLKKTTPQKLTFCMMKTKAQPYGV